MSNIFGFAITTISYGILQGHELIPLNTFKCSKTFVYYHIQTYTLNIDIHVITKILNIVLNIPFEEFIDV